MKSQSTSLFAERNFDLSKSYAKSLDQQDVLSKFRDEFYVKEGYIYLDGNSLGLCSKRAEKSLLHALEDWKQFGIDGWTEGDHPWFYLSEKLGNKMAPLVGAQENEVVVTGSTTSNLHQLLATFYRPEGKRTKIIADELNFPSDIYALQSHLQLHGLDPESHLMKIRSRDGRTITQEDIMGAMTEEIALLVLPTVLYRSGQLLDIQRITSHAHELGMIVGFDACHSIGAIPHEFHSWNVDFAYWCTYKYLNSGPGAVGALFVHEKHFSRQPGLAGWFGSDKQKQFDMEHTFTPAPHAGGMQIGTPHILSMSPLIGSLEMFHEATIQRIRAKSLHITSYLMYLIQHELQGFGFHIGNPLEDERRGGHVCLEHDEAARICKSLKAKGIIPDFRAPNVIRLAPVSLYTSYGEVFDAVQCLKQVMMDKEYEEYENKREVIA
ncbi:kynureninase [Longirhabdus pacifica]|uniref:kynureninase n=1 Tax=Longirhabdus pacifica TaxID=2305227 RepID=UPI00100935BE|nr:kynureninase [Longirhabdus pacifica]